jgi:hypothetical protein
MAAAQAHGGGSVGDGRPVSQEYQQPGTSDQPSRDGGRTLPHQERPALGRREADREGGFASTRHTETSLAEKRKHMFGVSKDIME